LNLCHIRGGIKCYKHDVKTGLRTIVKFKKGIVFFQTIIDSNSSFDFVTFLNSSSFEGSTFKDQVYFRHTNLRNIICFNKTVFNSKILFYETRFHQPSYFEDSSFLDNTFFDNVTFNDLVRFNNVKFKGGIDFYKTKFRNTTYFTTAEIYKKVKFEEVTFSDIIYLILLTFKEEGQIIISDTKIDSCSFLSTDFKYIEFINVEWLMRNKKIHLLDEILLGKYYDKQKYIKYVEILYRQLKSKYLDKKDYNLADDFLHGEYRMKLKQKKGPSWEWLYKVTSDFGMNWWKSLLFIGIFIIFFSILTWLEMIIIPTSNESLLLVEYDQLENKYISVYSNFVGIKFISDFLLSLGYHSLNSLLVPQKIFLNNSLITSIISRIENIIVVTLSLLSAFAIRRKFRH